MPTTGLQAPRAFPGHSPTHTKLSWQTHPQWGGMSHLPPVTGSAGRCPSSFCLSLVLIVEKLGAPGWKRLSEGSPASIQLLGNLCMGTMARD